MTASSSQLLKMLEPLWRPVAAASGPGAGLRSAFEDASFAALLEQARHLETGPTPADAAALLEAEERFQTETASPPMSAPAGPLAGLGTFDRIENTALRQLLASSHPPRADTPEH